MNYETRQSCPKCETKQSLANLYCSHCGKKLQNEEDIPSQAYVNHLKAVEKASIESLQKRAHSFELETLEKIQQRVVNRFKLFLFFLSLVVSLGAWFGIDEFNALKAANKELKATVEKELKQSKEKLEKDFEASIESMRSTRQQFESWVNQLKSKLDSTSEEAQTITRQVQAQAEQLSDKLEQFEKFKPKIDAISTRLDQLDELEHGLSAQISQVRKLANSVEQERRNVEKLQNSFFTISIQVNNNIDSVSTISRAIIQKGFTLREKNILAQVSVDKTSVIYYSDLARDKAEIITEIIRQQLKQQSVDTQFIPTYSSNTREIVVKLSLP